MAEPSNPSSNRTPLPRGEEAAPRGIRHPLMPWQGYVLANAVVVALAVGVWKVADLGWLRPKGSMVELIALPTLMFWVVLAFFLASVFDFAYDRLARWRALRRVATPERSDGKATE